MEAELRQETGRRTQVSRHYAWVIAVLTFFVLLINGGVRIIPSIIMKPLEAQFHWSRAQVSAAFAISFITFGLGGPLAGRFVDRFSPKAVMGIGLALIGAGLAPILLMTSSWQLSLYWGGLVGLGTGLAGTVVSAVVAERWFDRDRGLVLGAFGSASSIAQMVFFPLLVVTTASHGWRGSVGWMLLGVVLLLPLVLALMKSRPSDIGLSPYGGVDGCSAMGTEIAHTATAGATATEAMHTLDFWLLAGTFFICGFTSDGLIGTHFLPFAADRGFVPVLAASALGLMGLMNAAGTVVSGWLTDRSDSRRLLAAVYTVRALTLFGMPLLRDRTGLFIFAALFGLDWSATVPPTIQITAKRFGNKSMGTIFGLIFCAHMLGAGLAAYAGGLWHDLFGGYPGFAVLAGVLGMTAAVLSSRISGLHRQ